MYTNHPFFLIDSCVFTAGKINWWAN